MTHSPSDSPHNRREIRAPHGMRMLMNNLDPDVAENAGGAGGLWRHRPAARNWDCFDRIVASLKEFERGRDPAGAVGQAGRRLPHPCRCAAGADRQFQPGAALGHLGDFHELDAKGLMMYGQMTAGSWIYIGSQGIVQGTYETFVEMAASTMAATSPANGS